MFSCTIIVMSCVSLFPIKKDGIIWATFVLTARPPCGRRGQAVTNSRNCLISQFLSETQRKVVFHGQLFLLQVQLAIRMSKRAFQRSKDVQRCPKPSSLTIFFQVSCGQAPAKQVAQSKNIYTAQTTCTGSHKRIQQSNRNGLKKTTVNPHGPIVASSINRRGLPLATNESSSWKLSAVKCHTAKGYTVLEPPRNFRCCFKSCRWQLDMLQIRGSSSNFVCIMVVHRILLVYH